MMRNKTRRVVIALAVDEYDNVLMGKRCDNKKYAQPAGKLYMKEDPYQGMKREFLEETGVDIEEIKLIGSEWDKDRNLILYLFKVVPVSQEFDVSKDPDGEFESLHYIDPNNIVEELHVPIEQNIALRYWMQN